MANVLSIYGNGIFYELCCCTFDLRSICLVHRQEFKCRQFLSSTPIGVCKFSIEIFPTYFFNANVSYFSLFCFEKKFSLPWNQTTLVGYAVELTTLGSIGLFYFVVYGTFLMLFLSICMHHQAFSKMFKYLVDKLNRSDVENQCDKKSLCNLIRFHISVKK